MSFHAHFLYTDGMREYFVQIVPDVPEILSFAKKQKEVKRVDTEPVTPKPVANDKIHNVIGEKKDKVEEEQSNH